MMCFGVIELLTLVEQAQNRSHSQTSSLRACSTTWSSFVSVWALSTKPVPLQLIKSTFSHPEFEIGWILECPLKISSPFVNQILHLHLCKFEFALPILFIVEARKIFRSVESRYPFKSYELIEFAWICMNLQWNMLLQISCINEPYGENHLDAW